MKPLVIGIAGASASGKSTFAGILSEELKEYKVKVMGTDKYFKRPLPKITSPLTKKEYDDFNHPTSLDYDRLICDLKANVEKEDEFDLIILEGLYVLYFDGLKELMDLKIFIDLDTEERMYRRIKRNIKSMGLSLEEIGDYFIECARYREKQYILATKMYADIILDGNNLRQKGKDVILYWLRGMMEKKCIGGKK